MYRLGIAIIVASTLLPCPTAAAGFDLLNAGVRARVGEKRVLGQVAPESFNAYDLVATVRL
ncbi:MAG: hypothetical protein ING77_05735, partial [Rhodocyclaceae bacterium]|nr:hypothetical protein [Rhodocyclaceae bacterium]